MMTGTRYGSDVWIFLQGIAVRFKLVSIVDIGEYNILVIEPEIKITLEAGVINESKTADNGDQGDTVLKREKHACKKVGTPKLQFTAKDADRLKLADV